MDDTVDYGDNWVCSGCGKITPKDETEGWRQTDAQWCPDCAWLS